MKIIAIGGVTAGGKTSVIAEIKKRLAGAASLHFDDYSFEGEVDDYYAWAMAGADYNVWNVSPLRRDVLEVIERGRCEYLLLDYPFAYCNDGLKDLIDCAIFIDTPLDVALARRILRDLPNADGDEIREELTCYLQYARTAYLPMLTTVRPSSDYIVDGTKTVAQLAEEIIALIRSPRLPDAQGACKTEREQV